MLTSGVFNRNNSAQYFVNIPEHGVSSLRGLVLKSAWCRQGMLLALIQSCTLTAVRFWIFFFSLRYKVLYQTPTRWTRGFIYAFLPIIWMIKSRRTRRVGRVTSTRGEDKFLQGILWGNLKERENVLELGVDGRIILKWILHNWTEDDELDLYGSQ
jgi:hypothetical protein